MVGRPVSRCTDKAGENELIVLCQMLSCSLRGGCWTVDGDCEGEFEIYKAGGPLEIYKNFGGASGVHGYEIGQGSITVQFRDGWTYVYTNLSAGAANITEMQRLAEQGQGLNSFIGRVVRTRYAEKFR